MSDVPQSDVKPRPMPVPHWAFLIVFYAMAAIWGVRHVYYWEPSSLDFLVPVGLAILLSWWAISDSISRGRPIGWVWRAWFFFWPGFLFQDTCSGVAAGAALASCCFISSVGTPFPCWQ